MTVTGRVAEVSGPRKLSVREQAFAPPSVGQVLVKVSQVGICASELADWRDGPAAGDPPIEVGHEPFGTVHSVGAGVEGLEPGQPVTGRLVPSLADYVYADPADVVAVPDGVDRVLGEPLGCVVEGYRRAVPGPGARTVVVGLGFMGLVMVQLLAASPTAAVWAVDPRPDARDVARRTGATRTLAPDDPALHGEAFELVVEASGTQPGLDQATRLAAEQGTVSILGFHQAPSRAVDVRTWNWKALDVVNAHVRDRHRLAASTAAALRLLAAGRLWTSDLVTHSYPLEQAGAAFEALEGKPPGFVKAVVTL